MHRPVLTFAECKRVAQATFYFGPALLRMLSDWHSDTTSTKAEQDQYLYGDLDTIDDCRDMESLMRFLDDMTWPDQVPELSLGPATKLAVNFRVRAFPADGHALLAQLDTSIAFVEAALSWHGGGRMVLERQYPRNLVGLGKFIQERGTMAETIDRNEPMSRNHEANEHKQHVIAITPFVAAQPGHFERTAAQPSVVREDREFSRLKRLWPLRMMNAPQPG